MVMGQPDPKGPWRCLPGCQHLDPGDQTKEAPSLFRRLPGVQKGTGLPGLEPFSPGSFWHPSLFRCVHTPQGHSLACPDMALHIYVDPVISSVNH